MKLNKIIYLALVFIMMLAFGCASPTTEDNSGTSGKETGTEIKNPCKIAFSNMCSSKIVSLNISSVSSPLTNVITFSANDEVLDWKELTPLYTVEAGTYNLRYKVGSGDWVSFPTQKTFEKNLQYVVVYDVTGTNNLVVGFY